MWLLNEVQYRKLLCRLQISKILSQPHFPSRPACIPCFWNLLLSIESPSIFFSVLTALYVFLHSLLTLCIYYKHLFKQNSLLLAYTFLQVRISRITVYYKIVNKCLINQTSMPLSFNHHPKRQEGLSAHKVHGIHIIEQRKVNFSSRQSEHLDTYDGENSWHFGTCLRYQKLSS